MAIVEMQKVTIAGLSKDKFEILEFLMKTNSVEVANVSENDDLESLNFSKTISLYELEINKLSNLIKVIGKFDTQKTPFFSTKKTLNKNEYGDFLLKKEKIIETTNNLDIEIKKIDKYKFEKNHFITTIENIKSWECLTKSYEDYQTRKTTTLFGTLPIAFDIEKFKTQLFKEFEYIYINEVYVDKLQRYLAITYLKKTDNFLEKILGNKGFIKFRLDKYEHSISREIECLNIKITEINLQIEKIENKLKVSVKELDNIKILHDFYIQNQTRNKELEKLKMSKQVFFLNFWTNKTISSIMCKDIFKKWDIYFEINDPKDDDDVPILLENNNFIKPFEIVTEMYSMPKHKTFDPNTLMVPFFIISFGLMIGDAGYGLVLALVTGFVLWKFKPKGNVGKFIKLIFYCGLSTLFFGSLLGGWFGNLFQILTHHPNMNLAIWFDPLKHPMEFLVLSFVIGITQLYTGMGIKAYMLIKRKKYFSALFDVGFWYLFLSGFIVMCFGKEMLKPGLLMSLTGAILLVLTQGRREKSIIKKFFIGLISLYGVTGFLSDVLSYSRILALGLATGVIASVINLIATLFGYKIYAIIIMVIILLVGHTFNILINTLSAYVHSSRLQYVEFFGKFYESGGTPFKVFKADTKYYDLSRGGENEQ